MHLLGEPDAASGEPGAAPGEPGAAPGEPSPTARATAAGDVLSSGSAVLGDWRLSHALFPRVESCSMCPGVAGLLPMLLRVMAAAEAAMWLLAGQQIQRSRRVAKGAARLLRGRWPVGWWARHCRSAGRYGMGSFTRSQGLRSGAT